MIVAPSGINEAIDSFDRSQENCLQSNFSEILRSMPITLKPSFVAARQSRSPTNPEDPVMTKFFDLSVIRNPFT
jgi:hypothetical protein